MHFYFAIAIMVVFTALLLGVPALGADLTPYQWEYRLLLVFAPVSSDHRFMALARNLTARREDVQDRDLRVFHIFETGPSYLDGQELPRDDVEALRRRFKVRSGGFRLILIGKDGQVKLAGDERVALQAVFDLIDTMPMRRREMREKDAARKKFIEG